MNTPIHGFIDPITHKSKDQIYPHNTLRIFNAIVYEYSFDGKYHYWKSVYIGKPITSPFVPESAESKRLLEECNKMKRS